MLAIVRPPTPHHLKGFFRNVSRRFRRLAKLTRCEASVSVRLTLNATSPLSRVWESSWRLSKALLAMGSSVSVQRRSTG